ncbi:MAG: 16S rRNA (uracil(1498)-N(3))-methyltransferase [Tannerella sp.]|jgi:16S rRNA (uracil1498-N3)-methyltransferase|nr:16S rRNA (uracil(1498)-N(3))-methyltransferase [Tannerella sp.]
MTLFYAPDVAANPFLPEEESQHAIRVLRLAQGGEITVTDGKGALYRCMIVDPHPKRCEVTVVARWQAERPRRFSIHVAVAPTKSMERMEWFAEKATETGIDAITCLECRFSERREIKTARLAKILVSAIKQSGQARLPDLNGMTDFRTFVGRPRDGMKFIACCEADPQTQLLQHLYRSGADATILIGPEGDFSKDETTFALQHGFIPVSLGASRLRTETAALAACLTIHVADSLAEKQTAPVH